MLALTNDAAEIIRGIVDQSPLEEDDAGLRIAARPTSETEATLEMSLIDEPDVSDELIEHEGARVYLEPLAAEALTDKVLDASVEEEGIRFTIVDQTSGPMVADNGTGPTEE